MCKFQCADEIPLSLNLNSLNKKFFTNIETALFGPIFIKYIEINAKAKIKQNNIQFTYSIYQQQSQVSKLEETYLTWHLCNSFKFK